ncbi:mutator transposase mudra protein [Citrus sinensis]|nr:mutator transposase mudra protein [Citrus sinensis]
MGCAGSSQSKADGTVKKIRKPKPWKHPQPITKSQLMQLRDEFWDTAPHYGGRKEIWDALRAAAEADLSLAQAIVDSAGVIVQSADLTICYDERGTLLFINFLKYQHILYKYVTEVLVETYVFLSYFYCCALQIHLAGAKYELPKYVLSEPTNLIREG